MPLGDEEEDGWGTMRISKDQEDDGQKHFVSLVDTKLLTTPSALDGDEDGWGTMRINRNEETDGQRLLSTVNVNCLTIGALDLTQGQ